MIKLLTLIIIASIQYISIGQYSDALLWTSTSAKARVTKNLNVELDFQFRFNDNISQLSSLFIQPVIKYEIGKNTKIALGYRGSNNRNTYNFETKNRLFLDLGYSQSIIKKLNGCFRVRTQYEFNRLQTFEPYIYPEKETTVRFRYGVKYGFKKWKPSLSNEWFLDPISASFYAYRINIGLGYKISKRHSLKCEYTLQTGISYPTLTKYIYKIAYTYNLKGKLISKSLLH